MATIYPQVEVRKSATGMGLFSVGTIKKNQVIIEYTGERISAKEANKRGGLYLFGVTKKLVIDAREPQHLGRYINHACQPNAEAEHDTDEDRIFIRAIRKILPGEEITYHYGKEYFKALIGKKNCGCMQCREKRLQKALLKKQE